MAASINESLPLMSSDMGLASPVINYVKTLNSSSYAFMTLGWAMAVAGLFWFMPLFGRPLKSKQGHMIPKGPTGLPILGEKPFSAA
jgi:hypothetical protein